MKESENGRKKSHHVELYIDCSIQMSVKIREPYDPARIVTEIVRGLHTNQMQRVHEIRS